MSEGFLFQSRPQSIDEIEDYGFREYFPEANQRYQSMKIKRFDILGVFPNLEICKLRDRYTSCLNGLKSTESELEKMKITNNNLFKLIRNRDILLENMRSERDAALYALTKKSTESYSRNILEEGNSSLINFCEEETAVYKLAEENTRLRFEYEKLLLENEKLQREAAKNMPFAGGYGLY
jgi:hypothetical protein